MRKCAHGIIGDMEGHVSQNKSRISVCPVGFEYGWKRPKEFDPGLQYNAWVEYQWDTVFEFCMMMVEAYRYARMDVSEYMPLMLSCLRFYDEHYQYLSALRYA